MGKANAEEYRFSKTSYGHKHWAVGMPTHLCEWNYSQEMQEVRLSLKLVNVFSSLVWVLPVSYTFSLTLHWGSFQLIFIGNVFILTFNVLGVLYASGCPSPHFLKWPKSSKVTNLTQPNGLWSSWHGMPFKAPRVRISLSLLPSWRVMFSVLRKAWKPTCSLGLLSVQEGCQEKNVFS